MGATQPTAGLVYDDLASFPDDHLRRELIDGELVVTPSPATRHQHVVAWLTYVLYRYAETHGGRVLPAPLDVLFADDTVLEPDVLFVRQEHLERIEERFVRGAPDVVIEVSSPSTRRLELVRKRRVYERFEVPEYWYVDLDAERVELHRLADGSYGVPIVLGPGDRFTSEVLPELELAVGEMLRPSEG